MWKLLILLTISATLIFSNATLTPTKARVEPSKSRIIGGEAAQAHEFPYQAGLSINGNSFCGGALISEDFVLTAGHCAESIRTVDVVLGALHITLPTEDTRVIISGEKTILHEQFDTDTLQNDIALIKLSKSVTFNDYIQPVSLPSRDDADEDYFREVATAIGWGLDHDVPHPSLQDISNVLRKVKVRVSNLTLCEMYYNDEDGTYVTDSNICTSGHGDKGTCNGDSGGPLVLNEVLVGLTSFGTDQCEWCYPSVYTRVASYLDWIESQIATTTPTPPTITTTAASTATFTTTTPTTITVPTTITTATTTIKEE